MSRKKKYILLIFFGMLFFFDCIMAQDYTRYFINIEPDEDTIKYGFFKSDFDWDECSLKIIIPPKNADTAFIAENPIVGGSEMVYVQDTLFYRFDTLMLVRHCQNDEKNFLILCRFILRLIIHMDKHFILTQHLQIMIPWSCIIML